MKNGPQIIGRIYAKLIVLFTRQISVVVFTLILETIQKNRIEILTKCLIKLL